VQPQAGGPVSWGGELGRRKKRGKGREGRGGQLVWTQTQQGNRQMRRWMGRHWRQGLAVPLGQRGRGLYAPSVGALVAAPKLQDRLLHRGSRMSQQQQQMVELLVPHRSVLRRRL
jgi:hypothetical protein